MNSWLSNLPLHLPSPLKTNAFSPEAGIKASSSEGFPPIMQVSFSPEGKHSCHCPQTLTPWQRAGFPGLCLIPAVGEEQCPLTEPGFVPTLQFNPPVFTKLLWVPPHICERRWEGKGQNHTLPERVTTQLQAPAMGQTSSAVRPGRALSSDLRLMVLVLTKI